MTMRAMQGNESEESYAENSRIQNNNFHSVAKAHLGEAMKYLVCKTLQDKGETVPRRHHIAIADLGCSYGRNTLDCVDFILSLLHKKCTGEIQYFFSDLPSNDFNALFQSLHPYLHHSHSPITHHPPPKIFAAGVPGSFYDRLFPSASLDLVICSQSLHWLSQIPPSLLDKTSPAWNGGHTWISKVNPSKNVLDAYAGQSLIDMKNFLKSRAHEVISGGVLFLILFGRSTQNREGILGQHTNDHVSFEFAFEFFNSAWKELVDEGLISLEEMEMFNMPMYFLSQQELESAVKDVPEFGVLHMETIKNKHAQGDRMHMVEQWVGMISSTVKPTVEVHLGKTKADELFKKLKVIGYKQGDLFNSHISHDLVIASLLRL